MDKKNQNIVNDLSIGDYIQVIRRGLNSLVIIFVLCLLVTIYLSFTKKPVYSSTATIMINSTNGVDNLFDLSRKSEKTDILNIKELIYTKQVSINVVKKLWENEEYRKNLEIFGTRKFEKKAWDITKYFSSDDEEVDINQPYSKDIGEKYYKNVLESIKVTNKRETDIIKVSCTSTFRDEAQLLANTVVEVFKSFDKNLNAEASLSLGKFLEEQIEIKFSELSAAEEKLLKYSAQDADSSFYSYEEDQEHVQGRLEQLLDAETKYNQAKAEKNIRIKNKEFFIKKLDEEEKKLIDNLQSSKYATINSLRIQISEKESKLLKYDDDNPVIKELQSEIDLLKIKLSDETQALIDQGLTLQDPIEHTQELIATIILLDSEIANFSATMFEYSELIKQYTKELNMLPEKQLEYARLKREVIVLGSIHNLLTEKSEETKITYASEAGSFSHVEAAFLPKNRVKPSHRQDLLLGSLFGILIGITFLLAKEYFDNTVRSIDYIERLGLTILGVIPRIGNGNSKSSTSKSKKNDIKFLFGRPEGKVLRRRLITKEDPKSPISESYRMIRTNILYTQTDQKIKSILVTSPGPGEGKSTSVTNLAITFANLGKKTVLIDADLRKPVIHRIFKMDKEPGLTHFLTGNIKSHNEIAYKTDVENLHVIPSGIIPPNPSELLGSKQMLKLIDLLKEEYDLILLDSPPISAVTDPLMISDSIDKLVLIVKSGSTHKRMLNRAVSNINSVTNKLSGVILNDLSRYNSHDSSYYYYQYYNRYYGKSS